MTTARLTDKDFEEVTIAEVRREGDGYVLKRSDGRSLWIQDPGFTPKPGQSARFYGRGIGFSVRGVVIDGRECYYRTAAEQEQFDKDALYPRTAADALAKWDAGQSVFTVQMGGFGPGYEQCIHVAVFAIIRDVLRDGVETAEDAFVASADATLKCIDKHLGMSGAQAGAAKWLAFMTLRDGWQKVVLAHPEDRLIQVSKHWQSIPEDGKMLDGSVG